MKLKKDITFVYMDRAEYQSYYPIYEEAKSRGYNVKMTTNKFERCEIGFYCQHVNFPKYSKFSIIMLHDIIQGYGVWPNIWRYEPWDKYDIGILPGKQWVQNWKEASHHYYSHPRLGVYEIGWTKADIITNSKFADNGKKLFNALGLDPSKKTVLYAPAWENDNKQDDFVQSMLKLDVNIIIKQASYSSEKFPDIVRNIEEMNQLHSSISRVHIIDPNVNIMDVIEICDILVSEESSTMCEATILGKVAVSVVDWLIPDVTPSRLPVTDHPFTVKTEKSNLTSTVDKIIKDYDKYANTSKEYSYNNFSNIGNSAKMIMDIVDSVVKGEEIPIKQVKSDKVVIPKTKNEASRRKLLDIKLFLFEKYYYTNSLSRNLYDVYRRIIKRRNEKNV